MSMPAIHMEPHEWDQVASILSQHLPGHHVWAFGSRATGVRLKRFSDLDLAVAGHLTWPLRAALADAFDESLLPFKVDVVEIEHVDPSFLSRIRPDFVELPVLPVNLAPTNPVLSSK